MKKQAYVSAGTDNGSTSASREELKLRMVEHITAQYNNGHSNYVRDVINETKPRAARRSTFMKMVKAVLTAN